MRSLKKYLKQFLKTKIVRLKLYFSSGYLESKSETFEQLFPHGTKIKRIATGFEFTEGPIWFAEENYLLFSDIPANKIYKLTANKKVAIFR